MNIKKPFQTDKFILQVVSQLSELNLANTTLIYLSEQGA